ncbi:hypothetical protein [Sediminibacterium sp.]|uniref:hypothetical protein n=1 Tax=Sediminibacterium sp. TaxID=1917865 RepID=UPI0025FA7749|nr:hypothetical protein [Sediminibacterium sp.]MBW0177399.1 hypothetical protein [Sediminibacterium sp.]
MDLLTDVSVLLMERLCLSCMIFPKRSDSNFAMPPKERLKKLEANYPWIVTYPRIKDYMLAGYLGIDKTTLSKYRHV